MPNFTAIMYEIQLRLGLHHRPAMELTALDFGKGKGEENKKGKGSREGEKAMEDRKGDWETSGERNGFHRSLPRALCV